ncbi:MAG: 50S ribosomal protein L9 [Clostridiales bacterium]|jgi:large subunit ribosomal protein L9|nr:50S ribosomal protein L9 [Clostridiales bacterium]
MKVILLQDIKNLGKKGEVKEVAEGYGRNYLIPQGQVAEASKKNMGKLDLELKRKERRESEALAKAQELAQRLENTVMPLEMKAGGAGRLFGSATNADIAAALAKQGIELDKRKIELKEPVKTLGQYEVLIKLHSQVQVTIILDVKPIEG